MRSAFAAFAIPLALAACAEAKWAPDADVQRAAYVSPEPPSITLYTAIRNSNGEGGHSAILVNSGQRVMFDPAGTWWHTNTAERNDVIFGMTPTMLDFYIDYHARETYHVVEQKIYVSPEVAALAMAKVQANGAVPKAMCGANVSNILNDLPGFQSIPQTFYPAKIMRAFEKLPNVQTRKIYDDDSDDNTELLAAQARAAAAMAVN